MSECLVCESDMLDIINRSASASPRCGVGSRCFGGVEDLSADGVDGAAAVAALCRPADCARAAFTFTIDSRSRALDIRRSSAELPPAPAK